MPRFSIIVPTYNRAHLLPRCLNSVLAQTFTDFEIIVADDGSTDATRDVVRALACLDARVNYVHQENKGAGEARNLGADRAKGQYLTFLDSDDEAHSGWLEALAAAITGDNIGVVCCGIEMTGIDGRICGTKRPAAIPAKTPGWRGLFLSGTFAVRRELFKAVGGYATALAASQHSELRFRILDVCESDGWRIACLSDVLVRAHDHTGPKIRRDFSAIFDSAVYVLTRHHQALQKNPRSYADWASAAAGCAAKLRRYRDARVWFMKAISAYPRDYRNYVRFFIACSPGVRRFVWRERRQAHNASRLRNPVAVNGTASQDSKSEPEERSVGCENRFT